MARPNAPPWEMRPFLERSQKKTKKCQKNNSLGIQTKTPRNKCMETHKILLSIAMKVIWHQSCMNPYFPLGNSRHDLEYTFDDRGLGYLLPHRLSNIRKKVVDWVGAKKMSSSILNDSSMWIHFFASLAYCNLAASMTTSTSRSSCPTM